MAIPKERGNGSRKSSKSEATTSESLRDDSGALTNPFDNDEDKTFSRMPLDEALDRESDSGDFGYDSSNSSEGSEGLSSADQELIEESSAEGFTVESRIRRERKQSSTEKKDDKEDLSVDEILKQADTGTGSKKKKSKNASTSSKSSKQKMRIPLLTKNRRSEIDPENNIVQPIGSSRKKQAIKQKEIDARRNKSRSVKLPARIVVFSCIGLVALSAVQTIMPKKEMTANDAAIIARQATGMTGFPINAGEGIAKDFVQAYLTIQSNDTTNSVLSYYYSGKMSGSGESAQSGRQSVSRTASSSFSQNIVYGPTVYGARAINSNVAMYTIGALVQPKTVDKDKTTSGDPRMVFFNVNVVYNSKDLTFSVAPDSPTMVPATSIKSQRELPKTGNLGSGQQDPSLKETIRSTVNGYMQGYAQTGSSDSSKLDQYVTADAPVSAKRGLNNEVTLADGDSSITYEAYPSQSDKSGVTEIKTRVHAQWVQKPESNSKSGSSSSSSGTQTVSPNQSQVTYGSQYVMTLTRQADGRYLVSNFVPETYVPSEDSSKSGN